MYLLTTKIVEPYRSVVEELAAEPHVGYWHNFKLKEHAAGRRLLEAPPGEQLGFVLAAAGWLLLNELPYGFPGPWKVRTAMLTLLRHRLPFGHEDLIALLDWCQRQQNNYWRGAPHIIKTAEDYLKEHELTPALREKLDALAATIGEERGSADARLWQVRLRELGGQGADVARLPFVAGEAWADAAVADIEGAGAEARAAWLELLAQCAKARGSSPSAKWLKAARAALEKVGRDEFRRVVLGWFALADRPRTRRIETWSPWQPDPNLMMVDANADLLRALVWLCAEDGDGATARALNGLALSAYRKVPGVGPRCVRVGNACVWALGQLPGPEGVGQLALLKVRVKFGSAQKGIESALAEAARRAGLSPEEIEEMSVPTYGMEEVGLRREQLGEYTAELAVVGNNSAELRWVKPDGRRQNSVPRAVREEHAAELKELTQAVKDVRKMLPAQAERLDNLYLEQKSWPLAAWRERYLDHPLVGTLARRLIWKFTEGERAVSGVWHEGRLVGGDGRPLDWPGEATRVELWHPIHEAAGAVLAWRDRLAALEVRQPLKQAHREVYVLTDAERATRVYSNRFAAHIIRQHQFNALCAARRWRNKLRLMVDDEYPPATRPLPRHNLRAEFWIEGIGEDFGRDTTEAGTYLYLTTDQVRFYPLDAPQLTAHADGGAYRLAFLRGAPAEPLELELVPPLVFSEVMRDVDLFVGVASVANDPHWADGGPEGRHQDYWARYSFGELSETAKTRRQVLERLVPRLKIAARCRVTEKFLVVRGDVRTYKIHLGSGNILMEPNDQYLCIVPARGAAAPGDDDRRAGRVFLPFEGDNTLAVILSKAFLLAEDAGIEDPTIRRQIRPQD